MQIPDRFLREVVDFAAAAGGRVRRRHRLPARRPAARDEAAAAIEQIVRQERPDRARLARRAGRRRDRSARGRPRVEPLMPPALPRPPGRRRSASTLERRAFCVRKRIEREVGHVYFPSLSGRTLVYKGMLTTRQLREFFPDLADERFESAIALVHCRFSTNTFPSLAAGPPVPLHRAQRRDQHRPGQPQLDAGPRGAARAATCIPGDLERLFPICTPGALATRPASTRCSSCCTSAAAACRTRC